MYTELVTLVGITNHAQSACIKFTFIHRPIDRFFGDNVAIQMTLVCYFEPIISPVTFYDSYCIAVLNAAAHPCITDDDQTLTSQYNVVPSISSLNIARRLLAPLSVLPYVDLLRINSYSS